MQIFHVRLPKFNSFASQKLPRPQKERIQYIFRSGQQKKDTSHPNKNTLQRGKVNKNGSIIIQFHPSNKHDALLCQRKQDLL